VRHWARAVVGAAALLWLSAGSLAAQTVDLPAAPADSATRPATASADTRDAGAAPAYHDYFHALGYSFSRGLFAREQIVPLAIGSAAALAMAPFDRQVSDAARGHAAGFGRAGEIIGSPFVIGALSGGLILGSLATDNTTFRSYAFTLSQGLIVATTVTSAAKLAVRRTRPDGENHWSFPSGHAAATFALATVSSHYYGKKAGIPLYALASLVAASRVGYGKHFPTDVIVGATIGYVAGRAAIRGTQHVTVGPTAGTGVNFYLTF
jgi:membrane-associated phospholipid phosphatase